MTEILIVENERVTAWDLQEALEHLGYRVSGITGSGTQAMQLVRENQPDLVLMDIRLDDEIDGIVAASQIRQQYGTPVIYLTAHADEQTLNRALSSQPFGYLIKPFNQVELRTTIETALARYQLEKQLYATQQWLWTTLNSIGDGAIATDSEGRIQLINPTAASWTGWTSEDAIGQPVDQVLQLLEPETRVPLPSPFKRAIAHHQHIHLDSPCLLVAKNGDERYIGDVVSPILNPARELLGCVLIFQDITDRIQAQREMQMRVEREHLLRTLSDSIRRSLDLQDVLDVTVNEIRQHLQVERVIVYQFDDDFSGSVIAESLEPGQISMLGVSIADPCLTLAPCIEKYSQCYVQAIEDIEAAGLAACYVELLQRYNVRANLVVSIVFDRYTPWGLLVVQHCSAPRPWIDEEVTLLTQLADQLSVAVHQSRLYSQLKRMNEALGAEIRERSTRIEQISQYETLLHHVTERVWQSLDENQIIQSATRELQNYLKILTCYVSFYSSDDLSPDLLTEASATSLDRTLIAPLLRQGELCQFCVQMSNGTPDVKKDWRCVLVCPMYEQDDNLLGDLVLVRPVGESFSKRECEVVRQVAHQCAIAIRQSRLNQAAQEQMHELERLNRLKDDFLSTVSHELRTPIANIRMATQMLEIAMNRLGILDNSQSSIKQYFKILKAEGQREINLIDDLLNLSRLEAGVETLNPILVDLRLWVVHISDSFSEMITGQQQELVIHLPETLPLIYADLSYLERIVSELMINACKYTPQHEQIHISALVHSDRLDLCITNTGVSIPMTERSRIFEKFYRIPNSDRWKHGGTGLGLALARKLARVLGGNLTVESTQSSTSFILSLPLSPGFT